MLILDVMASTGAGVPNPMVTANQEDAALLTEETDSKPAAVKREATPTSAVIGSEPSEEAKKRQAVASLPNESAAKRKPPSALQQQIQQQVGFIVWSLNNISSADPMRTYNTAPATAPTAARRGRCQRSTSEHYP